MINLEANSWLTKWFVWSCDHLPFTVTRIYGADHKDCGRRKGSAYIESGTTLCHIFWATLWVPVAMAAFSSLFIFIFVTMHFAVHQDFIKSNPNAGSLASIASYFIPEGVALGIAALAGLFILSMIGGSKSGFFMLLWQYLKGIKQRVCPLVKFR